MPEAPEVRRYADELAAALTGKKVLDFSARTKQARAWLEEHPDELKGRVIERVFAHGKNIIGLVHGDYFFYSHQMMWGRWEVHSGNTEIARDRRERARIVVKGTTAILMSAPIFEIGVGDPLKQIPLIDQLGPYVLPYSGKFDKTEFKKRLLDDDNAERTIGDALLDQRIAAGLGNYLRAEIMFLAKLDPWRQIKHLKKHEVTLLCELVEQVSLQAYETNGVTVTPQLKARLAGDPKLVYVPGKEYGTHHYAFRRTNLPCLICSTPIKQLRQTVTRRDQSDEPVVEKLESEAEELSRIVYFCPICQTVNLTALPAVRRTTRPRKAAVSKTEQKLRPGKPNLKKKVEPRVEPKATTKKSAKRN